jgi:HPr kinase/phosphorylase
MAESFHVLGPSAIRYLLKQDLGRQRQIAADICSVPMAALVIPGDPEVPAALLREGQRRRLPVIFSREPASRSVTRLSRFLKILFTAGTTVHGVLMEVFGVGVLILGPSGIGKSESALDLVMRGHRLIADDIIVLRRLSDRALVGSGTGLFNYHMEIRGLGIINIQDLFGVAAVLSSKAVELVVELEEWNMHQAYDRLGVEEERYCILNFQLPYLRIPVNAGRNMAVILEVAARNHLLKKQGGYTARELDRTLSRRLVKTGRGKSGRS